MSKRRRPPDPALAILLGLCFLGCSTIRPAGDPPPAAAPLTHAGLDRVLRRFVDEEGRVDYRALKKDEADLQAYYAQVAAYSPDSHPDLFPARADRLAYWINAYNAAVLVNVLRHYPIAGVTQVKAPAPLFFMPERSGFFYFHRLLFGGRAWDHAAPAAVVAGAGGRFSALDGETSPFARGGLYSNGRIHDELLEWLASDRP